MNWTQVPFEPPFPGLSRQGWAWRGLEGAAATGGLWCVCPSGHGWGWCVVADAGLFPSMRFDGLGATLSYAGWVNGHPAWSGGGWWLFAAPGRSMSVLVQASDPAMPVSWDDRLLGVQGDDFYESANVINVFARSPELSTWEFYGVGPALDGASATARLFWPRLELTGDGSLAAGCGRYATPADGGVPGRGEAVVGTMHFRDTGGNATYGIVGGVCGPARRGGGAWEIPGGPGGGRWVYGGDLAGASVGDTVTFDYEPPAGASGELPGGKSWRALGYRAPVERLVYVAAPPRWL